MASWTGSWRLLTRVIFTVSGLLQVWAAENSGHACLCTGMLFQPMRDVGSVLMVH